MVASLKDGVESLSATFTDYGLLTTPQLHYITRCLNTKDTPDSYGIPTVHGYYEKLSAAFNRIAAGKKRLSPLFVDCANGIGAPALRSLAKTLGDAFLVTNIVNDDTVSRGKLNSNCGADYVKLYQKAPQGTTIQPGQRWCSLDGDADRIVFYYADADGVFKLLDGDKIATLSAGFIMSLIRDANLQLPSNTPVDVGLVQTAYANGSSTSYVKDILNVPVVFTPTGVKHLHHEAEHFDVGVYFEANGHGTILFSKRFVKACHETKGYFIIYHYFNGFLDLFN